MDLELGGKVALVAGGSKGIGRQVARTLAREGAKIAIVARTTADLVDAKALIEGEMLGAQVHPITADLTSEPGAQKAVREAVSHFGRVDILVNCAGAAPGRLLLDIDDETWLQALGLKFLGYMRMAKAIIPHFLALGGGVIVNVIGNDGVKPSYWEITGTAANAAGLAAFQALADQYGRDNIRINSVNPGPVDTGRWETLTQAFARDKGLPAERADEVAKKSMAFGRICTPQEVADVVVFLASARASFVHGTHFTIDANQRKAIMDVDPEGA